MFARWLAWPTDASLDTSLDRPLGVLDTTSSGGPLDARGAPPRSLLGGSLGNLLCSSLGGSLGTTLRCLASRSLLHSTFLMRRLAARSATRSTAHSASSMDRFTAHSAARTVTRRVCPMRRSAAPSRLAQWLS